MQQPVPLGTLHPPTKLSQSLGDFERGTNLLSTGLGDHAGAPFVGFGVLNFAAGLITINKPHAGSA